ncbi:MAG TPA: ABC transporter permease subunit [Tepidisphaeraceae bacterium]|jgi:ABC-type transport system involved in multi-copper enzyme maturation permease subunit|nr:ABC transporter permease subunit [Tepidisphaeraceae bacterium]
MAIHLSKINPFGPIFEKELRVASRRKRNHLLRVLYLLGLFLILMLAYLSMRTYGTVSVAARMERQNQLGQVFFACFGMFCAIAMGLIGPVLTCTAISAERLHRTLHVLLMTPITSWQIISGKLCSRLLIAFLLLGLSLPVLAVVRLLGGVEIEQMFAVISMCAATAIFCGAVGLFFSTFLNRAYSVLLLSYASLLFLYLFLPFVSVLLLESSGANRGANQMWFMKFMNAVHPFFNIGMMTTMSRFRMSDMWVTNVVLHLATAGVLVTASAIILRRLARKEGEGRGEAAATLPSTVRPPLPSLEAATANERETILPYADPALPSAKVPTFSREVADNPVLWREIRRPLINRTSMQIVCGILVVTLLIVSYIAMASARTLDDRDGQIGFAFVFNGLLWLVISIISATAIAQEKESDTWTLLLATPLGARDIVFGKLAGLARRLFWPFMLIVAHFFIFAVCGVISFSAALSVLWIIFTFNSIWIALGLFLSLRCRKVTFAVIVNLLMPIGVYAVVPLLGAILGQLVGGPYEDRFAELTLNYLPYFYLASVIDGLRPDGFHEVWMPTFGDSYHQYDVYVLMQSVIGWGLFHLGLATFIVYQTVRRFNRIVGRAEQFDPLPAFPVKSVRSMGNS